MHTVLCEINTHSSEIYGISVVYVYFDKLPSRGDEIDDTLGTPLCMHLWNMILCRVKLGMVIS